MTLQTIYWQDEHVDMPCPCPYCKLAHGLLDAGLPKRDIEHDFSVLTDEQIKLFTGPNGYALYKAWKARSA